MKRTVVLGGIIVLLLALTNPDEADFREHVREKNGLAGTLGMALTDLLSGGKGGIRRDNYIVASRFHIGGGAHRQSVGCSASTENGPCVSTSHS